MTSKVGQALSRLTFAKKAAKKMSRVRSRWSVCITLAKTTPRSADVLQWLKQRLTADGFQCAVAPPVKGDDTHFLCVSCSDIVLERFAEQFHYRLPLRQDAMARARFTLGRRALFKERKVQVEVDGDSSVGNEASQPHPTVFSSFDRRYLLMRALEQLPLNKNGWPVECPIDAARASTSSTLMMMLRREKIVKSIFPMHDPDALEGFSSSWVKQVFQEQPLDQIRDYFGEDIALYFGWLGFYTRWLVPPSAIGLIVWFLPHNWQDIGVPVLCLILSIWSTLFTEFWKRHESSLTLRWGVHDWESEERVRPEFRGELRESPVTGEKELHYPTHKRLLTYYLLTFPLIFLSLGVVVFVLAVCYQLETMLDSFYLDMLTIGLYGVLIPGMSSLYRVVATWLTERENHRTELDFQYRIIAKLVLFEFFNCFLCLFWVAFVRQDFDLLYQYVSALLMSRQVLGNVLEVVVPYVMRRYKIHNEMKRIAAAKKDDDMTTPPSALVRGVARARVEAALDEYSSTYDDYLEMIVQLGYVVMFTPCFPVAPLFAFLNNIVEVRSDAFKLVSTCQRPHPRRACGIGVWQQCLEGISLLAVIVNTALILFTSGHFDEWYPEATVLDKVLILVAVEHIVVLGKLLLAWLIPDVPPEVQLELARQEHMEKEIHAEEFERKIIERFKREHKLGFTHTIDSEAADEPPPNTQ